MPAGPNTLRAILLALLIQPALLPAGQRPQPNRPQTTADQHHAEARSLVTQGRRAEAQAALEAGQRLAPNDPRFPTELAGIAFLDERYADARKHLKRALRLAPNDPYLIDFLATIYLLEENLDAALLYWNRISKPRIEQVDLATPPTGDVVLLDRALAFAPASTLELSQLRRTRARLDHLDLYAQYRFDLLAREDRVYDLQFRALNRPAWRESKPAAALSLLRGLPYQTVHAEFFDVDGRGLNIESLARWDPRKRRAYLSLSRPAGRDPRRGYEFFLDARDEDWRFAAATGESPESSTESPIAALGLQKAEAGLTYSAITNARLTWRTGVTFAVRNFQQQTRELAGFTPGIAAYFAEGPTLNSTFGLDLRLLDLPEHRLSLDATADWRLGRFWGRNRYPSPVSSENKLLGAREHESPNRAAIQSPDPNPTRTLYSQWTQSLTLRWFPKATGHDYAVETRWRSGQTFGAAPFDELYALGMDRDTDLWLRAHRGIAGGYKGASLLGDRYLLWSTEIDKIVYNHPFLKLTAGPFLDAGMAQDSRGAFGSQGWQGDSGIQCKAKLTGGLTVAFSYGRSLQSNRDAFYWRITR